MGTGMRPERHSVRSHLPSFIPVEQHPLLRRVYPERSSQPFHKPSDELRVQVFTPLNERISVELTLRIAPLEQSIRRFHTDFRDLPEHSIDRLLHSVHGLIHTSMTDHKCKPIWPEPVGRADVVGGEKD